jgi:hypothetical protein
MKNSLEDVDNVDYSINWKWAFRWLLIGTRKSAVH